MASYNADINVNVNVFDRKLRDLERRIQALDKIANPKKPLTRTQAAVELKAAKEELEVTKIIQSFIERKQQAHNKLKQEYAQQVRLRKEELSYEERSLRLANARKLQESRLTSLERAGAFEGKGRSAEISGLLRKRDQFSQSPAIQERVATALGRILTLQKAINRADIKNIGQKQRIDDYNKRIEALRRVGVSEGKLRNVIKRRSEFTTAADKRQDVIADKRERQLKRELQLLERKNRLALKAFNTEAKIQSTPLSRAAKRIVLGTPEAEAKKAAFYAKKAIQDAKELDRQEILINKTLDDQRKLREKNAKAAKRLAEQQLRAAQRLGGPRSALPPRTILGSDEAIRQKYEYYQKIGKTIKAVSSALPPRSVLGSDEAIRQKYEYYQKIGKTIKAASSPIRGTATMVGSPKYIEAQAKATKKLTNETKKLNKERDKGSSTTKKTKRSLRSRVAAGAQGLLTGAGFSALAGGIESPLQTVGGAVGGLVGGFVGGPAGGLAGSIILSAIGGVFDKLGKAALTLADAFADATENMSSIIAALGRGSTRAFSGQADFLASQGLGSVAGSLVLQRFEEIYGRGAVDDFNRLAETSSELKKVWAEISVEFQRLMAGPLGALLNTLKSVKGAPTDRNRFPSMAGNVSAAQAELDIINPRITVLENLKKEQRLSPKQDFILNDLLKDRARLQRTIKNLKEEGVSLTGAEKDLNDEVNKLLKEREGFLNRAVDIERTRLSARRDTYATEIGSLEIDKAQANLDKIQRNLDEENKRATKDTAKIEQLKLDKLVAQADVKTAIAKQSNEELLAQRALRRDTVSQLTAQLNTEKSMLATGIRRNDLVRLDKDNYVGKLKALDLQDGIEKKLLEYNREMALQGVTEAEIRREINKTYDDKLLLQQESIKLQKVEVKLAEIARRDAELARQQSLSTTFTDARRQQQQQIRNLDPSRAFSFAGQGLGFFGQSGLFEANRLADSAAQLEAYNEQIANLQARYDSVRESGPLLNLEDVRRLDSISKEIEAVQAKRDAYEQLQPAIDRAAIFQARYNDALTAVTPGVDSLISGLQEVVAGTKTAQEAFADFLRVIADQLIQTAARMIAQYIALGVARSFALGTQFSFSGGSADAGLEAANLMGGIGPLPKFADGGSPPVGRPSIVGERGPELFVPKSSGTIVPNNALGGDVNVVVNVTETQTDTRGNGARANQVGNALAAAVQAEIIKQKRPGGLLAN